jgi:hypothetical protein
MGGGDDLLGYQPHAFYLPALLPEKVLDQAVLKGVITDDH